MGQNFTDDQLIQLIHEQGMSQKDAAQALGVSEGAISKRLKKLKVALNNNTALFSAPKILDKQIGYMDQLEGLGRQARELLELVNYVVHADNNSQEYWEAKRKLSRLLGAKGSLGSLLVQLQAELRKQLEFYLSIQKEAYNIRQVKEFQEVVLDEIKRLEPEAAQRIVGRLVELNAAHSSLDFGLNQD